MTVLGFSSSPIVDGNVDRMVKFVLLQIGNSSELVNLSQLTFSPCRACAHLCAPDNLCKLDDDLEPFFPRLLAAEALVLGTPAYFGNMNGFMMVFLERLWAFRHQRFAIEGKPYVVVAAGGIREPEDAIAAVKKRMSAYGAVFMGAVGFTSTIIPCFRYGFGNKCEIGAAQHVYGTEGRQNLKISRDLFKKWEDSPELIRRIEKLSQDLKTHLAATT